MSLVSIHQPHYLIWIGLLDKIAKSDTFIVLDDVQYNKRSFQHRTLYSTSEGAKYLSLSVESKGSQSKAIPIKEIKIADQRILLTHYKTLYSRYGKSPGWDLVGERLEKIYNSSWVYMIDLNLELLTLTLDLFSISPRILMASELKCNESKGALMYQLVARAQGSAYLSGVGAKDYMDAVSESKRSCPVEFQAFEHPVYQQTVKGEFQAGAAAIEWAIENPQSYKREFKSYETPNQPYRSFNV